MSQTASDPLTPQHFLPFVDKPFRVDGTGHVLTLSNVEVRQAMGAPQQPFTLIFRGEPGNILPEGTRVIEVDGGPSFEMYIMPIHTPARDRQDYQAVFN